MTFDDLKKCRSLDLLTSSTANLSSESEDELDVKLAEHLRLIDEEINILIEERNEAIRCQFYDNLTSKLFHAKGFYG